MSVLQGWEDPCDKTAKGKYVDDTTVFQAVRMDTAIRHCSVGPIVETLRPLEMERGLVSLAKRVEDIGMMVNVKKTQLLCISPQNGCITSANICPGGAGEWIHSSERMKLVGFTFGPAPSVSFHVDAIREEYRRKVWLLFHLQEAGIKGENLFRLHCCYIRSRFEYLSAAYHFMLLVGQAEAPERLHKYAIRVGYRFGVMSGQSWRRERLNLWGSVRKVRRVDSFITKAARIPRFSHWFPVREAGSMSLRNPRRIQETQ